MNKSKTPEYQSWHSMLRRCHWPSHKDYKNYGGRGITVCKAWWDFDAFLRDMGKRPEGTTLERKDNSLGYFPANCRWATFLEQNFNRRVCKNSKTGLTGITVVNRGKTFRAYAKLHGVSRELYRGPDFFEAVCARKSWEARHCG